MLSLGRIDSSCILRSRFLVAGQLLRTRQVQVQTLQLQQLLCDHCELRPMRGHLAPARRDDRGEVRSLAVQVHLGPLAATRAPQSPSSAQFAEGSLLMHHLPEQDAERVDVAAVVIRADPAAVNDLLRGRESEQRLVKAITGRVGPARVQGRRLSVCERTGAM